MNCDRRGFVDAEERPLGLALHDDFVFPFFLLFARRPAETVVLENPEQFVV